MAYTTKQYAEMAVRANAEGKLLIVESGKLKLVDQSTPTLEETRTAKLSALRQARLAAEYGGFIFQGQRWDSELKDEQRLTSIVTLMKETGLPGFDGWKIAEGVYITLTLELALGAAGAMLVHYGTCFAEERRMIEEINALTSAAAVQAYEINFNIGDE